MPEYKTPGVYIEEISTLPASVAAVATAVPAFVGYTQKKERNGETIPDNTPVRITSLLEYQEIFGMPFDEEFAVTLTPNPDDPDVTDIAVPEPTELSPYLLYYHLQMFFNNGGGPCYVVPVGTYVESGPTTSDINVNDLLEGIGALEEEDEPTLLLVPEAVQLGSADRLTIHDALLAQCNKLQDRFAIIDALVDPDNTVAEDAATFRSEVGTGNLKYGAAYYPSLKASINRFYTEGSVVVTDDRPAAGEGPYHQRSLSVLSEGSELATGEITIETNNTDLIGDVFEIDGVTFEGVADLSDPITADHPFLVEAGPATTAENLLSAIEGEGSTSYSAERASNVLIITATESGSAGELTFTYTDNGGGGATISGSGILELIEPDRTLYNAIKEKLKQRVVLYPSGAMAGIYARVDRQRGVWKAPANVDVRGISAPGVAISDSEQEGLNIDATSGKSINAIRRFTGKGNLVWGARTLAGNDNEWRYIPVRRLFIFIEESVKKSTEFVVFEPNNANTWQRVKTMIENFLSRQWRESALAGAKPEEAFFVKVGLGETMTALDILEGRMNIEIGLAAVRPAEFIILKFSHKLQQS